MAVRTVAYHPQIKPGRHPAQQARRGGEGHIEPLARLCDELPLQGARCRAELGDLRGREPEKQLADMVLPDRVPRTALALLHGAVGLVGLGVFAAPAQHGVVHPHRDGEEPAHPEKLVRRRGGARGDLCRLRRAEFLDEECRRAGPGRAAAERADGRARQGVKVIFESFRLAERGAKALGTRRDRSPGVGARWRAVRVFRQTRDLGEEQLGAFGIEQEMPPAQDHGAAGSIAEHVETHGGGRRFVQMPRTQLIEWPAMFLHGKRGARVHAPHPARHAEDGLAQARGGDGAGGGESGGGGAERRQVEARAEAQHGEAHVPALAGGEHHALGGGEEPVRAAQGHRHRPWRGH